jgi:hypothetical protein
VSIPVVSIIDEQSTAVTIDSFSIAPSCKEHWRLVAIAIDPAVYSKHDDNGICPPSNLLILLTVIGGTHYPLPTGSASKSVVPVVGLSFFLLLSMTLTMTLCILFGS